MRRYQIIPIVILAAVLIAFGGVYQFYIKDRSEEFRQNEQRKAQLEARLQGLAATFEGVDGRPVKPEEAVKQYRLAVQPWVDSLRSLSTIYSMDDEFEFDRVPENSIPKFHYRDEFYEMQDELYDYAYQRNVNIDSIDPTFGLVDPDSLEGKSPTADDVNGWLSEYAYNIEMTKRIIDSGAVNVREIEIWPTREEIQLLELRTVGYNIDIELERLVSFLRSFYNRSEYVAVDALRITNQNLLTNYEPLLNVQMLITEGKLIEGAGSAWDDETGAASADSEELKLLQQRAGAGGGLSLNLGGGRSDDDEDAEAGNPWLSWNEWRKWLRRYIPL